MTFKQFFNEAKIQPLTDKNIDYFIYNPHEAVNYAENLGTEWDKMPGVPKDKAQKIIDEIGKYPVTAMRYAGLVMKRRWPEVEHIIAKEGDRAADYVLNYDEKLGRMTGTRWVDLENIDPKVAERAEKNIILHADDILLPSYIDLFTGRWPELEKIVFSNKKHGPKPQGIDINELKDYYIQHLNNIGYTDDTSSEYQ